MKGFLRRGASKEGFFFCKFFVVCGRRGQGTEEAGKEELRRLVERVHKMVFEEVKGFSERSIRVFSEGGVQRRESRRREGVERGAVARVG